MQVKVRKINQLLGHSGSVYALEQGANKNLLFSGSSDRFVALWNIETLQLENFSIKLPSIIYTIHYINEKEILLIGTSSGSIHIVDLKTKKEVKILQYHTGPVFNIKYNHITNCFYSVGGDGNFAVYSLELLSLKQLKKLCNEKVRSIDFNSLKAEISVASGDGNIRIFDLNTLVEKYIFTAHKLSANIVRYAPNGNHLLTGGRDAHLNIWDTSNYTLIKSIPAHNYAIYDIVYAPHSNLFATASRDKTIKIWNAETFELLLRINKEHHEGHINSVNKLLWSNYNDYLISTGDDRAICIWNIETY